ncbi:MAG: DUF1446 domain-containing protein [Bacteroidetes bacterium]|nr:DUF1446 domain-containing protein [Bacteroidota bacterium]
MKQKIRIGCGAGFSGDRIEPAVILAEKGELDYLVLECLAERTIALAQKRKMANPDKGYDPYLERRIEVLLPHLVKNKVRLITNMGAANPVMAAKKVKVLAEKNGFDIKVAAVFGDDVLTYQNLPIEAFEIFNGENQAFELIKEKNNDTLISANAYIGVDGIIEALDSDAQIIITGRVADPSLFLAPMICEFGWSKDDYELLGKGTVIGHLMECAGHITGGYFADPVKKPVQDMIKLGHPYVDVFSDGSGIISKVEGTGGVINLMTAKEQLLYEVVNPNEYFTPDVVADFTTVKLEEIAENQVKVTGGGGKTKPENYKVSVGYKAFFLGEGEISYAGPSAFERAKLAGETIEKRVSSQFDDFRIDYIGINSVFGDKENPVIPNEVRLRIAGKAKDIDTASLIGEEVEALYTNGPAGGGGVRKYANEVIGIMSVLVKRNLILPQVKIF